jgi:FG-GAP repeat
MVPAGQADPSDAASGDFFGSSVAISGSTTEGEPTVANDVGSGRMTMSFDCFSAEPRCRRARIREDGAGCRTDGWDDPKAKVIA